MLRLARLITRLNIFTANLCVILFLLLLAIVMLEVICRYFFNAPTIWTVEASQYLFGICFLLTGGYTLAHKGHVRVDIIIIQFSKRIRYQLGILCYLISIFYLGVLELITFDRAVESITFLETMDSVWAPYTFPVLIFVPIGVGLVILQAIAMIIETAAKLRSDHAS